MNLIGFESQLEISCDSNKLRSPQAHLRNFLDHPVTVHEIHEPASTLQIHKTFFAFTCGRSHGVT